MSKAEILAELPKLTPGEQFEIAARVLDLLAPSRPTAEEKEMLDRELEDYAKDGLAGSPWPEVEDRLRRRGRR